MFVSLDVHPLVGCHPEVSDLVDLAAEQQEAPGEGEELGDGQHQDGGPAGGEAGQTGEAAVGGTRTFSS